MVPYSTVFDTVCAWIINKLVTVLINRLLSLIFVLLIGKTVLGFSEEKQGVKNMNILRDLDK